MIKVAVANHFHVAVGDIEGRSRAQPIAWARQLAMYLTAEANPRWGDRHVTRHFGVNRSTVTYARQTVRNRMEVYPQERELTTLLLGRLKDSAAVESAPGPMC